MKKNIIDKKVLQKNKIIFFASTFNLNEQFSKKLNENWIKIPSHEAYNMN